MASRNLIIGIIAAAVVGVLAALVLVVSQAPVPVKEGTAPSVVTRSTGEEAQPLREPGSAPPARQVEAGGVGGRGARGTGVEGVSSGGTTHSPPTGR